MDIATLYTLYEQQPDVQTDTRKLTPGCMFFALSGANFDGNKFALEALDKGAAYAVVDDAQLAGNDKCIVVDNVLVALQQLANHHRQQLDIPFIAITGSNGKTTTKELVTAVLARKYMTYATAGNLNNHIGVPLTILRIKKDAQMAVIEMGANHQKEIAAYCEIAMPDYGIITNCGKAHIEGFGGIEGVRKGKGELYDYIRAHGGKIFRNVDLDYLVEMAHDITEQITYGSANATYTGRPIMQGVFLQVATTAATGEVVLHTHLVGAYNFPNVMVAVAVGQYFGISMNEIKNALEGYNPDNSRSQWLQIGSNKIILDAYNANPTSMQAAIINFAEAELPNKCLWIGGMKEMGSEEEYEHRELVRLIAQYEWREVILVGHEFKHNLPLVLDEDLWYKWFETSAEAAAYIREYPPEDCSILIKGSRGSKMEVMAEALKA